MVVQLDGNTRKKVILLPKSLHAFVFNQLHAKITAGHLGTKKTRKKIQNRFYWCFQRRDIDYWCSTCDTCASRKQPHRKGKAPMKIYLVGQPLERIAIDLQGPYPPSDKGNKYILVVGDYFTKWTHAIPLKTQESSYIARKLVNKVISIWGSPMELFSDRGSNFESQIFTEMCDLLGIHKTRSTVARPNSDGMVERANRTLENMISAFVSSNQKDWDKNLPLLTMAYNSSIHESTGFSPYALMYGREMNLPIDLALGRPTESENKHTTDHVYDLQQKLLSTHKLAQDNLELSSTRMKKYYDKGHFITTYKEGDLVWFHDPKRKKSLSPKLQNSWIGPVLIRKKINDILYNIQTDGNAKKINIVHHDRLKPYQGESKPAWMKNQVVLT